MSGTPGPWTNPEPGVVESGGTWTFICPNVPDARLIAAAPEMAALLAELLTEYEVTGNYAVAPVDSPTYTVATRGRDLLARIQGEAPTEEEA